MTFSIMPSLQGQKLLDLFRVVCIAWASSPSLLGQAKVCTGVSAGVRAGRRRTAKNGYIGYLLFTRKNQELGAHRFPITEKTHVLTKFTKSILKWERAWREKRMFRRASVEQVFTYIHQTNRWGDMESRSGKGSNLEATAHIRKVLPELLRLIGVRSLLDIPCGDFHWMQQVELGVDEYVGADIVADLVKHNQITYGRPGRRFVQLNLIEDPLPACEVVFCRDCLVHLDFASIALAVRNIKKSGAEYLITTTFPGLDRNRNKLTGKFRPLNLALEPFNWPQPMELIDECLGQERYQGKRKSLGLWRIDDIEPPS
jgi:hypothetical protein